jgi:hypothetical protein
MAGSSGRRLVLMLVCLVGVLGGVVTINWIVNPYGVWATTVVPRAYRLTDAAVDQVGEHLSTPYRIRAERPETLLLGSSRVLRGVLVERTGHDTFFNASLSGSSLDELAAVLRLATANPRLQRVIWGVEFYAFDEKFVGFRHPEMQPRLQADERRALTLRVKETLFNTQAFRDSRRVLARAARRQKPDSLRDPVPWPEDLIRARLSGLNRRGLAEAKDARIKDQLKDWIVSYVDYRPSPQQLSLFQETVEGLRRAGREVILFVPPLSDCELETIDQLGEWDSFQRWKRELLGAVGPYWDFSGYGKLDLSPELFTDVPHFKPAVGQVILRRVLGMSCAECGERAQAIWNASVWVDAATIDAHLAGQEAARATTRPRNTRCTRVVERMLAAREMSTPRSR